MSKSLLLFLLGFLTFFSPLFSTNFHHADFNQPQNSYIVPPPEYPEENDLMIFFLGASYTLWKPYQGGMFVASTTIINPDSILATSKNWLLPSKSYRNGFKVNAGINTLYDGWKVESEYTFFYNKPSWKNCSLKSNTYNYYSPWLYDQTGTNFYYLKKLSSRFTNTFQEVNLILNRYLYAGNYLIISPWIGLLSAIETQIFNVQGEGNAVFGEFVKSNSFQTKHWWSIGPYSGMQSTYFFADFIGIYFSLGGSINLGCHDTSTSILQPLYPYKSLKTSSKFWKLDPMIQTNIGLKLDYFSNIFGIIIKAGWDMQVWLNHNTFVKTIAYRPTLVKSKDISTSYDYSYGDFSMQGLTLKVEIAF